MDEHPGEKIVRNLADVQKRIFAAMEKAERTFNPVKLVVVTKGQPVEVVEEVLQAGASTFGENYPEESLAKILSLSGRYDCEWHMIGHLQSRKAKIVAAHFDMLESLDRLDLAVKLNRLADESHRQIPVLLEFNVSGEESKSGWKAWDEGVWEPLIEELIPLFKFSNLIVQGLMTMPPYAEDPEIVRPYFRRLKRLSNFINERISGANLRHLSMGTSVDFQTAIEEGATIVRIGTAIVGARPQK